MSKHNRERKQYRRFLRAVQKNHPAMVEAGRMVPLLPNPVGDSVSHGVKPGIRPLEDEFIQIVDESFRSGSR